MYTINEFVKDVVVLFPAIYEDINDEDWKDNTTLIVGCFKRFTINAIQEADYFTTKRCFAYIENLLERDDLERKFENSIVITYIGSLDLEKLGKNGSIAYGFLPNRMKNLLKEINEQRDS